MRTYPAVVTRIQYQEFTAEQFPYKRLVCQSIQDSVITFIVPSRTNPRVRHGLQLDCNTLEIVCGCKDAFYRKQTAKSLHESGTELEKLIAQKFTVWGRLYPSILRKPFGLCRHAKFCRRWIKRHGMWQSLQETEAQWLKSFAEDPIPC